MRPRGLISAGVYESASRLASRLALACLSLQVVVGQAGELPAQAAPRPMEPSLQPSTGGSRAESADAILRYKLKLSEGTAWTNLKPESWVIFDVINGHTVTVRHSTNVVNLITGFSRWWDHPIIESRACRIRIEEAGKRLSDCINGITSGAGDRQHHQLILPPDSTIHDFMFELKWQEQGKTQEALIEIPARLQPAAVNKPHQP